MLPLEESFVTHLMMVWKFHDEGTEAELWECWVVDHDDHSQMAVSMQILGSQVCHHFFPKLFDASKVVTGVTTICHVVQSGLGHQDGSCIG